MNQDIFSFRRFSIYLTQYTGQNWKKLLQISLGILAFMILSIAVLPALTGRYSWPASHDVSWQSEINTICVTAYVFVFVAAASAFIGYDSKGKRVVNLTLPVSNFEKFLTYIVIYVVGALAVYLLSVLIADWLRVLTASIYAHKDAHVEALGITRILTADMDLSGNDPKNTFLLTSSYINLFSIQSFFFLAAAIWPRQARSKGFLSILCIMIGFSLMISLSFHVFFPGGFEPNQFLRDSQPYQASFVCTIVSAVTIIGMYALSYLRFKEMESIERW